MATVIHRTRLAAALAVALLAAGPALAEPIGFLAETEGSVELKSGGATSFTAAAQDTDVSIGDTIKTGRDSMAKLVLVDDTIITGDEETELLIDEYVVGPAATSQPSKLSLLAGHVRTKVGEAFGGETRLEMHTPTAVIGVKGTEWYTWYLKQIETTYVCVLNGIVTMESNDPQVSGAYEPPIGGCARVLPHARPEPVDMRDVGAPPVVEQMVGTGVVDMTVIENNDIRVEPPPVEPPEPPPVGPPEPPSGDPNIIIIPEDL